MFFDCEVYRLKKHLLSKSHCIHTLYMPPYNNIGHIRGMFDMKRRRPALLCFMHSHPTDNERRQGQVSTIDFLFGHLVFVHEACQYLGGGLQLTTVNVINGSFGYSPHVNTAIFIFSIMCHI